MEDEQLLQEFVRRHSEEAFTELVSRYLGLVYSAAFRKLGDRGAAEDVAQAVFTLLAGKARSLGAKVILAGWLYQTACFKAAQHLRAEHRRVRREQEAAAMQNADAPNEQAAAWERLEPLLDDAMQAMSESDRAAVLLRFFQRKRMSEVALALDLQEDAARKRVDRALEKLRAWFAARGTAYPAAAIAAILSAHAAQAAPGITAATVSVTALKTAASAVAPAAVALPILAIMKLKYAVITALVLLAGAVALFQLSSTSKPTAGLPPETKPITIAPATSGQAAATGIFAAVDQGRATAGNADDELRRVLARFRDALYAPPISAGQKTDPALDILYSIPVEKRVAALEMVLTALRDRNEHVCMRAIRAVPMIWPQGEAALSTLFELVKSKSTNVASAAMIAAAQARPNADIVPGMVSAAMHGTANGRRALTSIFPLLKNFLPGSEAAFRTSLQPYLFAPDPAWRSTAARALAQLPGPKDPAVLRELTSSLAPPKDGKPVSLSDFGPSLEAMMKMGPHAAAALPAIQDFAKRNPDWNDHINLVIKAIAPDDLHGVGVFTPLPPIDAEAAAAARQIEEGTMSIPQLAAVLENPKTTLIAARALAEFGPAASEALPSLQRAFEAAVQTDLSTAFVLAAAIERLDPAAPKQLLSATEIVPALQAVQAEAQRANVAAWNDALQKMPDRVPMKMGVTHQDLRALAADLGGISPRLREAFVSSLLATDAKFAVIFTPSR